MKEKSENITILFAFTVSNVFSVTVCNDMVCFIY